MSQRLLLATALVLTLYGNVTSELTALDNAIRLSWTYTTTNITFTLVANTTGWAAVGFSPHGGMEGADIVMIVPQNGNITIQDRYATGMLLPTFDAQQDYTLLDGSVANGQLRATFSRLLDTCDPNDAIIKGFTTKIIMAYGALDGSGNAQYHGTSRRVSTSLHLLSSEPEQPRDAEIFYIDPVPQNISIESNSDTIYWCSIVQLSILPQKTHIIEMIAAITAGNEDIVHHMLVYLCDAPVYTNVSSFECFDGSDPGNQKSCRSLIGAWAVGGTKLRFPSNVGLPLEFGNSPQYILIQTHYNNMGRVSGRVDASYLRIVATQTLRPIDAGILQAGIVNGMLIPPKIDQTLVSGYCPSYCLSSSVLPSSGVNAFAVALHSHLLGRRITLRHFRPSQNIQLPVIADDPSYDFEFQEAIYLDSPRVILPGDVLQTVCVMNSSARNVSTQGGHGTMQEMCLSFIFYYPKVGLQTCQTSPLWMFMPNHPIYQLLGKNSSSFDWNSGVNDGLVGANWSTALLGTLKRGYAVDAVRFYCRVDRKDYANLVMPPALASDKLPDYTADNQQCQSTVTSTGASTIASPVASTVVSTVASTVVSTVASSTACATTRNMANGSTLATTAESTAATGATGDSSTSTLLVLAIVSTSAATVL